jgi:excisionase family DNA binding protein
MNDPLNNAMNKLEPLVGANEAAEYLSMSAVTVRQMAREGRIPAIPFKAGTRTLWRFRLSDLAAHTKSIFISRRDAQWEA